MKKSVPKTFKADNDEIFNNNGIVNKTVINSTKNNKSRNFTYMPNIRATEKPIFLTFNAKKVFNYLMQVFIKVWSFNNFIWKVISELKLMY